VLDDARGLSLFAAERLIWVLNAEAALPRGRSEEDSEGESALGDATPLAEYMKDPTPGVLLVFEASRYDFEGDDKRKQERVRKFYSAITDLVELRRFPSHEARAEAEALARSAGFRIDPAALDLLVEALGADVARIAVEIEKLALYAGSRMVGVDDIAALVPDARSTTIFALVNALGRRDRARALEFLDTLTREGEYLPLALAFLSTQFRMALVAREAGLKELAASARTLLAPECADVGIACRAGLPDGCQIQPTATGARSAPDLQRRQRPPRRPAGRPDRHGAVHLAVSRLARGPGPDTGSCWKETRQVNTPAASKSVAMGALRRERLHPLMQLGLVPRRGVHFDDPAFRGTVDNRKGLGKQCRRGLGIFAEERAPHRADLVTQTSRTLPIVFRAPFGLAHPLDRGISVCHLC